MHAVARQWWESLLAGNERVGLAWVVILGFLRITTRSGLSARPLPVAGAVAIVRSWLATPGVRIVAPGDEHGRILFALLENVGTGGNLTTDAHLAALAIEYRGQIATTDRDFSRFPQLRWFNPISVN